MKVTYIDHMGSDLSVVNAARVSFGKKSEWETMVLSWQEYEDHPEYEAYSLHEIFYEPYAGVEVRKLPEKDAKLIRYLARENHWTPFGHTAVTMHFKAPLFVARQLGKSQVGLVWNEVSRRYVDDTPEFYTPDVWRKRADNVKQGSSDEPSLFNHGMGTGYRDEEYDLYETVQSLYKHMLDVGVCPEQARMVLPQSMYTEWYWTGSIAAFSRVYKLRMDPHTQRETSEVAAQIGEIIEPLFPVSWKGLTQC